MTESGRRVSGLITAAALVIVGAGLYLARYVCIPLALGILFSFVLSPVVNRLQKWHLTRVPAALLVVVSLLVILGSGAWLVMGQLIQLADMLPEYRVTVHEKLESLHARPGSTFERLNRTLEDYANEVQKITAPTEPQTAPGSLPSTTTEAPRKLEVIVAKSPASGVEMLRVMALQVLSPLAMLGVVLILTLFMLIQREDLRDRVLRLMGSGQLNLSTKAMDDAAGRVSRYLLSQLVVNTVFGFSIWLGLSLIGVPYSLLWGLLAGSLRFMPYFGVPAAAIPPMVMAFVSWPDFMGIVFTAALFAGLELFICYCVEPWLYGLRTGLSPLAILGSALFWAWIWGPVGLLLATPLTVCLAVMGRHGPSFRFLNVIFGDEPALPLEARFYQRLLANDQNEASEIAEQRLHSSSLMELYASLLIPALIIVEQDRYRGELDEESEERIIQDMRDIIEDLEERTAAEPAVRYGEARWGSVLCMPADGAADELAACMLAGLLKQRGVNVQVVSLRAFSGERVEKMGQAVPEMVCVSAVPPHGTLRARYLCRRLRMKHPDVKVMVGLWQAQEDAAKIEGRLPGSLVNSVVTSMSGAVDYVMSQMEAAAPHPAGTIFN